MARPAAPDQPRQPEVRRRGTGASITGPADGGLIGMAALNARGFLDVTFGFPSGKTVNLDTIYDLDPEFAIDAASGHAIRLDGTQAPRALGKNGTTATPSATSRWAPTPAAASPSPDRRRDRVQRRQPRLPRTP